MTEQRDCRTLGDAMADQQTKPVGQSASALHPAMALTAHQINRDNAERGWIPPGSSPTPRQSVMRIDTRSAAENAATITVPNEVTCGRGVASQRRLPFSFGADRPPATS